MTSIHVLTAIENGKVKECIVIPHDDVNVEFGVKSALYEIYGAANVCSCSREIGHIPANIARFLAEKSICVRKEDKWISYSKTSPSIGSRLLVKLSNGWVCIATYMNGDAPGARIWKADNGEQLISVVYWKELI